MKSRKHNGITHINNSLKQGALPVECLTAGAAMLGAGCPARCLLAIEDEDNVPKSRKKIYLFERQSEREIILTDKDKNALHTPADIREQEHARAEGTRRSGIENAGLKMRRRAKNRARAQNG